MASVGPHSLGARMTNSHSVGSIEWLIEAIRALPFDAPVPHGTPGYNQYTTQKAHWLGWLDLAAGTGSYPRSAGAGRDAKYVYNHIIEPKLLLWLVTSAGVNAELVASVARTERSVLGSPGPRPPRRLATGLGPFRDNLGKWLTIAVAE